MGCMITGERENKTKRGRNGFAGHVFACVITGQKCSMLAWMVMVIRGKQGEQKRGNKGCEVQGKFVYEAKSKKTNREANERGQKKLAIPC